MSKKTGYRYRKIKNKQENKMSKKKRIVIEIVVYILCVFFVIALAFGITKYGFAKATMVGDSMAETLINGDSLLINKIVYRIAAPKRFDVVAYKKSSQEHGYISIKRVIGEPGDKVKISDGDIYINDKLLNENINVEKMTTGGLAEEEITLDENEYFLLGDNRNDSEDSRFANVGMIVRDDIIGKVWIRLDDFGFVSSFNHVDAANAQSSKEPKESK